MNEYTKGEWVVGDWGHNKVVEIPETDKEICVVSKHYENYEANAKLIASAPDLYEALKGALWILKGGTYGRTGKPDQAKPEAIEQAEKALAKVDNPSAL